MEIRQRDYTTERKTQNEKNDNNKNICPGKCGEKEKNNSVIMGGKPKRSFA